MSVAPAPLPDRLRSLDALRGFDMFWIVGGDALGRALGKWYYGSPNNWVAEQLEHAEWEGFRFYDLIFPLFLFLVGTVIPFSLASLRRRGASDSAVPGRIIRRVILLFGLGLLCNGLMQLKWVTHTDDVLDVDINNQLRVTGVLQRIAICYGIAAAIALHTGWHSQFAAVVVILSGYWALLTWVPNPETGVAGDLSKEIGVAGYVDRHYLPGRIIKAYYGYGDNEGLLSTIPAVATALLGSWQGTGSVAGPPHPARPQAWPWRVASALASVNCGRQIPSHQEPMDQFLCARGRRLEPAPARPVLWCDRRAEIAGVGIPIRRHRRQCNHHLCMAAIHRV